MNVGLDDEALERHGEQGEQSHHHPRHGRRPRNRYAGAFAGKLSFSVTVCDHVPSEKIGPGWNLAWDALYCQRPPRTVVQEAGPKTRAKIRSTSFRW